MPFELEIDFVGLCLLVKHANKLHVLMPAAEKSHYEKHLTHIYYPGSPPHGLPVDGKTIEFLTCGTPPIMTFPTGIENLSSLWRDRPPVDRDLLDKPIDPARVSTRAVVACGQIKEVLGDMGSWDTEPDTTDPTEEPPRSLVLATKVRWTTMVNDVSLKPVYLENNAYKTLFDVKPPVSGPLRVEMRHVIKKEHGPKIPANEPTSAHAHLSAYYPLFKKAKGPALHYHMTLVNKLKIAAKDGVSPFTCMLGGGE